MTSAPVVGRQGLLDDLFSDIAGDPAAQAERLELFKAADAASFAETQAGRVRVSFTGTDGTSRPMLSKAPSDQGELTAAFEALSKMAGGSPTEEMAAALMAVQGRINKDWTPTNPVATGLFPYDLEPMARQLWPRDTPLRNTIPRVKGEGNAREFMRILSITNAGVPGGAAEQLPFFNSLTGTSTWGSAPVTLNRPPKISYTGDHLTVPYMELGVSDSVSFVSYFKGLGFDNQRTLSRTAALWAHLLGEERADLYGRGSNAAYEGVVAAPTGVTATGGASGGTIPDATYFVYVAAYTGTGYSAVSTVATTGALAGGGDNTITVDIATEPTGALAYGVWIGTVTGIANAHFQGIFAGNSILFTSYDPAGAVTTGTDSSALATAYDGFLTVQSNPANGYFARVNAPWNTDAPGREIDTALRSMFVSYAARPDEVWMDGASRQYLGELMRIGGNTGNGYRTNIVAGSTGAVMSTTVVGFANANTGDVLDLRTHRFMPTGCVFIRSRGVPYPDARIEAPTSKVNVQDYMAIEWPLLQMSYDVSTYQIGTLVHQAPFLNGLLVGVQPPADA